MWIRNAWYVAAWQDEVTDGGQMLARTILGEPIVLYRTEAGDLVALENRCCHRLAPLSKGRVEGDAVRCMYHGLKFGPDGKCIEIPEETRVPERYRVRHYPTAEKQNLIWIWMGDPEKADEGDLVDWPYLDDDDWPYKPGYLGVKASYQLIIDNLLDFSHVAFVHDDTIATFTTTKPTVEPTDTGLHIENLFHGIPLSPVFKRYASFDGLNDRWAIYDYYLRGNVILADFGSCPVGQGGHSGARENALLFRHVSIITPETEASSHYFFAQPRNFGMGDETLSEELRDMIEMVFNQDKEIVEAQQEIIAMSPDAAMNGIEADRALLHVRRQIDRVTAAEG